MSDKDKGEWTHATADSELDPFEHNCMCETCVDWRQEVRAAEESEEFGSLSEGQRKAVVRRSKFVTSDQAKLSAF